MNIAQQAKYADECKSVGTDRVAGMVGAGESCGARQTAKGILRDRVRSLRYEADQLEALAQSLPEVLPPQADSALWTLLIARR